MIGVSEVLKGCITVCVGSNEIGGRKNAQHGEHHGDFHGRADDNSEPSAHACLPGHDEVSFVGELR